MAEKKTVTKVQKTKSGYKAVSGKVKDGKVKMTDKAAPQRAQAAARRGNAAMKREEAKKSGQSVTRVIETKKGYKAVSGTTKNGKVKMSDRDVPARAQSAARRGNAAKERAKKNKPPRMGAGVPGFTYGRDTI